MMMAVMNLSPLQLLLQHMNLVLLTLVAHLTQCNKQCGQRLGLFTGRWKG
jgi:hypothetical protein